MRQKVMIFKKRHLEAKMEKRFVEISKKLTSFKNYYAGTQI